jgi:hypothetical protein
MRRTSMCLAAIALAVTACAPVYGERTPRSASVPEPPFGLIVGVAAVARTPGTPPAAATSIDAYLAYKQPHGVSGELLLATSADFQRADPYQGIENGLTVAYRPFALKLPAVRSELVSFDTRWLVPTQRQELQFFEERYKDQQGNWRTRSDSKWVTVTDYIPFVNATTLPATGFDIAAGKVRYIGRVGMVVHSQPVGSGPSSCQSGTPENISLFKPAHCVARAPFMENGEAADLAMIRQYFPKLAGVEIEVRPLEVAPGSWQTLPEAARRFGAGR